jgi:hypothetical protein
MLVLWLDGSISYGAYMTGHATTLTGAVYYNIKAQRHFDPHIILQLRLTRLLQCDLISQGS